jgi:hypothetical protein
MDCPCSISPVLSDLVLFSYESHLSALHLSTATQGHEEVSEGSIGKYQRRIPN